MHLKHRDRLSEKSAVVSQLQSVASLFIQANADAMRAHDNAEPGEAANRPIDLRLLRNAERKPPFIVAFETDFREVVNLLRPAVPMEMALQMCIGLGQGTPALCLSNHLRPVLLVACFG